MIDRLVLLFLGQFLVFAVSLCLCMQYNMGGEE